MVDKTHINLANVETQDLINEIVSRGFYVYNELDTATLMWYEEQAQRIYEELAAGNSQKAIAHVKNYVSDITGRILPC